VSIIDEERAVQGAATKPAASKTKGTRKKTDLKLWFWRLAVVPIALGIWQLAYQMEWGSRTLLVSPADVWAATVTLHTTGALWANLFATIQAAVAALFLASLVGVPIGIALGMLPKTWSVLSPYINALNSMPRIALAPVFIVLFGIDLGAKVALGFSIAVFIFMMNARVGVVSTDAEHRRVCLTLGATKLQLFRKLYLPVAVPAIFTAFRLGMVYALLGVVSSEIIASRVGMGQVIASYSATLSMSYVYSALVILAIFASILTVLAGTLENAFLRWQRAGEQG
jgi:ABC-type nitrate/sulfonate/bicarbonate transport system permease component